MDAGQVIRHIEFDLGEGFDAAVHNNEGVGETFTDVDGADEVTVSVRVIAQGLDDVGDFFSALFGDS